MSHRYTLVKKATIMPKFDNEIKRNVLQKSAGNASAEMSPRRQFQRCYTLDASSDQMFRFQKSERKSKVSELPLNKSIQEKLDSEKTSQLEHKGWGLILNYVSNKDEKSQINMVIKSLNDEKKNVIRSMTAIKPGKFLSCHKKVDSNNIRRKTMVNETSSFQQRATLSTKRIFSIKEDLSKMTEDFENHSLMIQSIKKNSLPYKEKVVHIESFLSPSPVQYQKPQEKLLEENPQEKECANSCKKEKVKNKRKEALDYIRKYVNRGRIFNQPINNLTLAVSNFSIFKKNLNAKLNQLIDCIKANIAKITKFEKSRKITYFYAQNTSGRIEEEQNDSESMSQDDSSDSTIQREENQKPCSYWLRSKKEKFQQILEL